MSALEAKITITAIDRVSSVVKGISKSLDGIAKSTGNLSNSWSRLSNASGDLVNRVRNISLVAIAAGTSIFALTNHYANYAHELELSSVRTGVGVEALQKLQYAAGLSGVSVDSLNTSLKFLNRSIGVASTNPTSQQAAAFYSMGINARDTHGKMKNVSDVIIEMSSRFQKSTVSAQQVTTAMATMGRAGTEMIPFLKLGPEKIKELMADLEKVGHVWSPKEVETGTLFEESFLKLKTAVSGVASVIAINLMPVLQPIVDSMTKWIVANKLWLADNIKQGVIQFSDALKETWKQLIKISEFIMPVVNSLGGFKNILLILSGLYLARFAVSIGQTIGALFGFAKAFSLVSWAILASPITWIIAGIALMAIGIYEVIKNWTALKAYLIKIWPDIKVPFEAFANIVTLGMYSVVKSIYQNWGSITSFLSESWNWIASTASIVFNSVYNSVAKAFAPIMPYIVATWDGIKKYFTIILNDILGLFGTDLDQVEKKFSSVMASMKQAVMGFIGFITKPFEAIYNLFEKITGKISSIKNTLTGKTSIVAPSLSSRTNKALTTSSRESFNPSNIMQSIMPSNNQSVDIHMTIDYEGRPTKVTAKSPTPINFSASVGKMV